MERDNLDQIQLVLSHLNLIQPDQIQRPGDQHAQHASTSMLDWPGAIVCISLRSWIITCRMSSLKSGNHVIARTRLRLF